jgi:hypothetical protein
MRADFYTHRSAPWIVKADGDGNSDTESNYPPIEDEDLPF